jgi:hypothetical protein
LRMIMGPPESPVQVSSSTRTSPRPPSPSIAHLKMEWGKRRRLEGGGVGCEKRTDDAKM